VAGLLLGGAYRQTNVAWGEPLVRPPGAGGGDVFPAACIRCGQRVLACPEEFDALRLANLPHGLTAGTPYADDLRKRPCTLCQGHDELMCFAYRTAHMIALNRTRSSRRRFGFCSKFTVRLRKSANHQEIRSTGTRRA
jgi:ferredoxin